MSYKAAIFDLDGTLAYTLPDLYACVNRMLTEVGYPLQTWEDILAHVNWCERDFIKASLPVDVQADEAEVDRCVAIYTAIYEAHYCDQTTLYAGLDAVLAAVRARGMYLAVHTNKKHAHACGMIDNLLPPGTFDAVVGDGIYKAKPDPEGALVLAKQAGCRPDEVCFIGDSNVDMDTAVAAGMFPLGVTWGYRPAEVLLAHGAKALVCTAADILTVMGLE